MTTGPGYLLPTVISPAATRCITLEIPDDPGHIRAFLGQLDMLSFWWTWERDALKQGTQAARRWQSVVDSARQQLDYFGGCPVGFDIRVVDCTLQKTEDGGENWVDVIDLGECAGQGPQGPAGTDGASVELRIFEGWIQWRQDDDNPTWANLIALSELMGETGPQGPQGQTGEQGPQGETGPQGPAGENCECEDPPPPNPEEPEDGTRCAIAIALSNRAKEVWHDLWDNTNEIATLASNAITLGSAVVGGIVGFFIGGPPGAVGGTAAVGGLVAAAFGANTIINSLFEAAFDENALERFRCKAYCLLPSDSNEITQGFINNWIDSLVADPANSGIFGSDTPGASIAELMKALPLSEWQWSAWVAGTVDPAACELCICVEDPEEPTHDWSATFDFVSSDWGWAIQSGRGSYVAGLGFISSYIPAGAFSLIALQMTRALNQNLMHSAIVLMSKRVRNQTQNYLSTRSGGTDNVALPDGTIPLGNYLMTGLQFGTGLELFTVVASGDMDGTEGEVYVRKIRVFGDGTRPTDLAGVPN